MKQVVMQTSLGSIFLALDEEKAPITVRNFLTYVDEGFYHRTIFHRVISGFMIQGGGYTPEMVEKETHPPIRNEAFNGLSNRRGTIAMARTQEVDSATSQFFINQVDNLFLDYQGPQQFGYCVFGRVIKGMDVVDRIANLPTQRWGIHSDVPCSPVLIEKIERV